MAYCLLGLFEVKMPLLYGEGTHAFQRLQEEIIRRSDDESVFLWSAAPEILRESWVPSEVQDFIRQTKRDFPTLAICLGDRILLAPGPNWFASGGNIGEDYFVWRKPYSLTNKGLEIVTPLYEFKKHEMPSLYFVPLNSISGRGGFVMCVRLLPPKLRGARDAPQTNVDLADRSYVSYGWIELHWELQQSLTWLEDGRKYTIYVRR